MAADLSDGGRGEVRACRREATRGPRAATRRRVRRDHRGRDAPGGRRADRARGPAEARRADDALARRTRTRSTRSRRELARIWAQPNLDASSRRTATGAGPAHRRPDVGDEPRRRRAPAGGRRARAPRPSSGSPAATRRGRSSSWRADPDGPPWLDARIQAHCVLPRADAPETCTELIFLTAGGETGRHLSALVAPLLDPRPAGDRVVARRAAARPRARRATCSRAPTGSSSTARPGPATGSRRLRQLAALYDAVRRGCRSATSRSSGSRAGARRSRRCSTCPDFLPFLGSIRRIAVTYATHDETGAPGTTNVVKPLYHVAWLASRLGMRVDCRRWRRSSSRAGRAPARAAARRARRRSTAGSPGRLRGSARRGGGRRSGRSRRRCRPARRCGSRSSPSGAARELRTDVTAEAENVHVHTWLDGVQAIDRTFKAPRRSDVDLLGEALETGGRDPLAVDTIRMAAAARRAASTDRPVR